MRHLGGDLEVKKLSHQRTASTGSQINIGSREEHDLEREEVMEGRTAIMMMMMMTKYRKQERKSKEDKKKENEKQRKDEREERRAE